MINYIRFDDRVYRLTTTEVVEDKNIYSIIVGKNGTGKSRLLKEIVTGFKKQRQANLFNMFDARFKESEYPNINANFHPTKIIAVSTSPFDKFPIPRRSQTPTEYKYLGVRDISNLHVGIGYMSKIVSSLMESLNTDFDHWNKVAIALGYLGYFGEISILLSYSNLQQIRETISAGIDEDPIHMAGRVATNRHLNTHFLSLDEINVDFDKIDRLRSYLDKVDRYGYTGPRNRISINLSKSGPKLSSRFTLEEIIFLLNSGVLRLRDIELVKENGAKFSIMESSSGEQSVIISILGILSQIEHRSLICIDEPELSLHPEWQEKYIQLIIQVFSQFKECHFVIATHSPQIVSNLDSQNCYLVDMASVTTVNANSIINHSADFQLVKVFKAPGYRNEYLSRIAYSVISKATRNKRFDSEDEDLFVVLKEALPELNDNDPLIEIINIIEDLHLEYGGN